MYKYTFADFNIRILDFFTKHRSREEPLLQAINSLSAKRNGLYLEYGVYKGNSITQAHESMPEWDLYGFDSFDGLPEKWRNGFDKGCFGLGGHVPILHPSINLIKGWFETSIPHWIAFHGQYAVADLIHIDCDLYSSTKTILNNIDYLIRPSHTILVFDELINYPGYENHEIKALHEYCSNKNYDVEMLYCGGYNMEKFAIKVVATLQNNKRRYVKLL